MLLHQLYPAESSKPQTCTAEQDICFFAFAKVIHELDCRQSRANVFLWVTAARQSPKNDKHDAETHLEFCPEEIIASDESIYFSDTPRLIDDDQTYFIPIGLAGSAAFQLSLTVETI